MQFELSMSEHLVLIERSLLTKIVQMTAFQRLQLRQHLNTTFHFLCNNNRLASLEVMADDVEFLTPKSDSAEAQAYQQNAMVDTAEQKPKNLSEQSAGNSFVQVEDEDLPF